MRDIPRSRFNHNRYPHVIAGSKAPAAYNRLKEYEIYFPLRDNDGTRVPAETVSSCKALLVAEFGGLTLFPQENEGIWKVGRYTYRDQIMIIRVLTDDAEKARLFFQRFRKHLKAELSQAEVLIVEREVRTLGELGTADDADRADKDGNCE